MASLHPRASLLASIARGHPKAAILATATMVLCLPIWLPLLLISFPFLAFASALAVAAIAAVRRLSAAQQNDLRSGAMAMSGAQSAGMQGRLTLEDLYRINEDSLSGESRINEYLDDQLNSLSVVPLARSESAEEELLPCSFSFGTDSFAWKT